MQALAKRGQVLQRFQRPTQKLVVLRAKNHSCAGTLKAFATPWGVSPGDQCWEKLPWMGASCGSVDLLW